MPFALLSSMLLAAAAGGMEQAERMAQEATALAASDPASAVQRALEALEVTASFVPTEFVDAGRKGEVVEDEFVAAREAYRRHRARLYRAVGECQLVAGRPEVAVRYLSRAHLLEAGGGSSVPLGRALVALDRGTEALSVLGLDREGELGGDRLAVAQAAADAARLPSLQAVIDGERLSRIEPEGAVKLVEGPLTLSQGSRLSSGVGMSFEEEGLTLVYVGDRGCRTCSADLQAIARVAGPEHRVILASEDLDDDRALRQAVQVYRYPWPFLARSSFVEDHALPAPSLLVVARNGWVGALLRPPLGFALLSVLEVLERQDVQESVPRARWDRRPAKPLRRPAPPGLLPEGLAPGEDAPAPARFDAAVSAYRGGRFGEALEGFEALASSGDGWLLPPEARLNRALCLAGMGRRERARQLLLAIGDSRFQEDVDRILEEVGTPSG